MSVGSFIRAVSKLVPRSFGPPSSRPMPSRRWVWRQRWESTWLWPRVSAQRSCL